MDILVALGVNDGMARWSELRTVVTRKQLRDALASGQVKRIRRGVYAHAHSKGEKQIARSLLGVVSHYSAADLLDVGASFDEGGRRHDSG